MTQPETKHYVTFYSPGTFFAETTTRPIERPEPSLAVEMAETIVERYGAKPYAFSFETRREVTVPDAGSTITGSKRVSQSGRFFLGGKLETYDDVVARNDPKESILRSNMQYGCPIVIVNMNSYRSTQPFEEGDVIVDASGKIVETGNDPKWTAYRERRRAADVQGASTDDDAR